MVWERSPQLDDAIERYQEEAASWQEVPNTPAESTGESALTGPGTWAEIDLGAVMAALADGSLERPTPTVGRRDDDACLFYPQRVNCLFGDSGDGKTWAAITAAVQQVNAGHHVLWVDFEDNEIGAASRLLDLGVTPQQATALFHYRSPDEPLHPDAAGDLQAGILTYRPTLVILDSTGEAMSLDGTNPNADTEVADWMRKVARRIARLGPAVVLIDHVVKNPDNRRGSPGGSYRKQAAITGASYQVEVIHEFGQNRAGRSKLTCRKDRGGNYTRGTVVATFGLDATVSPYLAGFTAPEAASIDDGGEFRPTVLMEKVSRYVEIHPDASGAAIEKAVGGKRDYVRQAVALLIKEGYVAEAKAGQARRHRSVKPFREAPDDA